MVAATTTARATTIQMAWVAGSMTSGYRANARSRPAPAAVPPGQAGGGGVAPAKGWFSTLRSPPVKRAGK